MKKKQPIVVLVLIILTLAISVSSQQDSGHTCVNKLNCLQKLSGEGYSANQISCIQSKCMVTPLNESEGYEPENNEEILEGDVLTEEPPLENQEPIQTIEINNLKSEVAKLKTEISTIKGSIQTQSGSTTILKNDVNVVKNQVKQIESQLTTINNQLSNSLKSLKISPNEAEKYKIKIAKDGVKRSAFEILSRDGVSFSNLRSIWSKIPNASRDEEEQIEISAHYSGYLEKQKADIIAFRKDENLIIPENIDYNKLSGLSNEVKSKFKLIRPKTLGQALRIDGITPAAAYILLSHVKKSRNMLKRA